MRKSCQNFPGEKTRKPPDPSTSYRDERGKITHSFPRRAYLSKVRLRHGPAFLPYLEIFRRGEVEHRGDEVGREGLDLVVVRHHRVVVELAREGDLVLRRGQFLLERGHVLVRLELGIPFHDGEEGRYLSPPTSR